MPKMLINYAPTPLIANQSKSIDPHGTTNSLFMPDKMYERPHSEPGEHTCPATRRRRCTVRTDGAATSSISRRGRGSGVVTNSPLTVLRVAAPDVLLPAPPSRLFPFLSEDLSLPLRRFLFFDPLLSPEFVGRTGSQDVWNPCRSRFLRRLSGQAGSSARALSQATPHFFLCYPFASPSSKCVSTFASSLVLLFPIYCLSTWRKDPFASRSTSSFYVARRGHAKVLW